MTSLSSFADQADIMEVSYECGKVKIKYVFGEQDAEAVGQICSKDMPRPEFDSALAACKSGALAGLGEAAPGIIEFCESIHPNSVRFKRVENIVLIQFGLSVKYASGLEIKINTQWLNYSPDSKAFPQDARKAVQQVASEARRYIAGERAQGKLFDAA